MAQRHFKIYSCIISGVCRLNLSNVQLDLISHNSVPELLYLSSENVFQINVHHVTSQTAPGSYQMTLMVITTIIKVMYLVFLPTTKTKTDSLAFRVVSPHTWNSLPVSSPEAKSLLKCTCYVGPNS